MTAALSLLCCALFGFVTAKLVRKTVEWGRYSVLTLYSGFLTFCVAGVCLLYGLFNIFPIDR